MMMLGCSKIMDQLAMTNILHWYGRLLWREKVHTLKRALAFEVEGRKGGRKRHVGSRLRKKV